MWKKIKALLKDRGNQRRYLQWLWKQARPYRWQILFLMLIKTAAVLLGVSSAVVNKYIVDRAAASLGLGWCILLAVGVSAVSLALSTALLYWSTLLTEKFAFKIRTNLYRNIMDSKWEQLQAYHTEDLLTRMTSDINAVTSGIVDTSVFVVSLVVQLVSAFLLLYHYNWSLAVFALVLGPIAAFISLVFGIRLKKLQVQLQQSESNYRVYLQEHISHLPVIKAFCYEEESESGLTRLRNERLYWVRKRNIFSTIANTSISLTFSAGYLFAFISGAFQLAAHTITYGTLTAFLSLVSQVQAPIFSLAQTMPKLVNILASAGRIMDVDMLAKEAALPQTTGRPQGSLGVQAENLTFAYGQRSVLKDAGFWIQPGSITAVMGPSGAGKTTLIRLLLAFVRPQAGSLNYVDADGNRFPCGRQTREWISYVPQGNTLFSGSIRENLRFGNADADDQQMRQALEAASAWKFVSQLPDGLDTHVGEKATGLSEGQAQRISIARALLHPCSVILLDEATSALDAATEQRVLEHITRLPNRPTCILVTHRTAALDYCDEVLEVSEETVLSRRAASVIE